MAAAYVMWSACRPSKWKAFSSLLTFKWTRTVMAISMYSLNLGQKIILPALLNTKTIHPRATNDQNRPNVDPDDDVATRGKEEPPTGTEGG